MSPRCWLPTGPVVAFLAVSVAASAQNLPVHAKDILQPRRLPLQPRPGGRRVDAAWGRPEPQRKTIPAGHHPLISNDRGEDGA